MWPDRVSNPGPLTYESGALPIALRGPALSMSKYQTFVFHVWEIKKNSVQYYKFMLLYQQNHHTVLNLP